MAFNMNDVPALSREKVERSAADLLSEAESQLQITLQPPIDVELIADNYLNLQVIYDDLLTRFSNQELHGGLLVSRRQVLVEASLSLGRTNFTIGHEVGHWQLHRHLAPPLSDPDQVLLPGLATQDDDDHSPLLCRANDRAWGECQADWFAAALLMPAKWIYAAFNRCYPHPQIFNSSVLKAFHEGYHLDEFFPDEAISEALRQVLKVVDSVAEVGHFTNVSKTALRVRLETLKLITTGNGQKRLL